MDHQRRWAGAQTPKASPQREREENRQAEQRRQHQKGSPGITAKIPKMIRNFAAVFPNTISGGRLTREASIFSAELYAINAGVHEILKGTIDGNPFTIFSD